jgi:hypothetical protein
MRTIGFLHFFGCHPIMKKVVVGVAFSRAEALTLVKPSPSGRGRKTRGRG